MNDSVLYHRPRDMSQLRLPDVEVNRVVGPPSSGDEAVLKGDQVLLQIERKDDEFLVLTLSFGHILKGPDEIVEADEFLEKTVLHMCFLF